MSYIRLLYLASVLGVTGARHNLRSGTIRLVRFVRRLTENRIPLAAGFGISRPEHVEAVVKASADAAMLTAP